MGHKKDIQQPVIRNTQDLSPLRTARLSLPQSHEPDSDRGNSNSHLATSKFMPCPSMGELELWTDLPEGFPLPLAPTLLQPLMSLFTKEPTSENNINGKMQLKLSELPSRHDGTWVRGCLWESETRHMGWSRDLPTRLKGRSGTRVHEDVVASHATAGGLSYHLSEQLSRMRDGTEQREIKTGHQHHSIYQRGWVPR